MLIRQHTQRKLSVAVPQASRAFLLSLALILLHGSVSWSADIPEIMKRVLQQHCADCHSGETAEGGLDANLLTAELAQASQYDRWVEVFDRVQLQEMPPIEANELTPAEREEFLEVSRKWLTVHRQHEYSELGRVRGRKLNNLQLERSLHELLGIDLPLKSQFPEEQRVHGFSTVVEAQSISHFQLENHLEVIDLALDAAFTKALAPEETWVKELDARTLSRRRLESRTREPEFLNELAVVWNGLVAFYGRIPATTAREDGWYRFTVRAKSLKQPENQGVWCTVRSGRQISSSPIQKWVGAFEATHEFQEWTFETWLYQGEMLEIRPGDKTLKVARFGGGQVGTGEGEPQNVPGIAIESVVMEKFHQRHSRQQTRRLLFDNLSVAWNGSKKISEPQTESPEQDLQRLMIRFASRAFRRPVSEEEIVAYLQLSEQKLREGIAFQEALKFGYRAILCSPRFVYFNETPGALDDYEIASRLSYFLWSSLPDEKLLQLAAQQQLHDPMVLKAQVERLLNDPRGQHFIRDFANEWLELHQIDFTEPDRRIAPTFDLVVQYSMVGETLAYLQQMLDENLPIDLLVDSDFTYLNSRLARFYKIDSELKILGDQLIPVQLSANDHRGGIITHGSVLKITANGTNTSPVLRGVWLCERILGQHIPDPPTNVPAIEPDIRGAKTIREMLQKHKSDPSCASCHVKIDPPGFALENFDPAGQWREHYGKLQGRKRVQGTNIDSSSQLPDGRAFEDLTEFKQLILQHPENLARCVAEKLMIYGTGAPIDFIDRPQIQLILQQTSDEDYRFRELVKAVVSNPIFLSK